MVRSTFSGFMTAQLALSASQRALDVTGQNLANINTQGYTRQRLDLASISPTGASFSNMNNSCKVGQGVEMTGITQIRDPFLDIQYRSQLAKVGTVDAQDNFLSRLGDIFDETDSGSIAAALESVISELETMSNMDSTNQGASDNLVRSVMEVFLTKIHGKATAVEDLRSEMVTKFESATIPDINACLKSIANLNESIKNSQVLGNPSLELLDQRNSLIDELATYLPIKVTYEDHDIGGGIIVDSLKITFKDANNDNHTLIDDNQFGELDFKYDQATKTGSLKITDTDGTVTNDLAGVLGDGVLKGAFDALNGDGSATNEFKGIKYYEKILDAFVNTFATTLNDLNKINDGTPGGTPAPLFEGADASGYFTAANIKISDKWMKGEIKIKPNDSNDPNSTNNSNILAMIDALKSKTLDFKDKSGNVLFSLNCAEGYDKIRATQAIERKSTSSILNNRVSVLNQTANSKDSVSGVYLDEEVMNLMRYQQSYNAAARLMTTLDETLNTLINSTGIVGR